MTQQTAWQPIATAPKDGTEVLVAFPHGRVMIASRMNAKRSRRESEYQGPLGWEWPQFMGRYPTSWQPIPKAPLANGEIASPTTKENDNG